MRQFALACIALLLVGCAAEADKPAAKAEPPQPRYTDVVLTHDKDSKLAVDTFAPDVPKIFVTFNFENVPNGSKLRGTWICEKSEVAPPNYKIDEATLETGLLTNSGDFSLSKPTTGWPIGDYRVELYIDDQLKETVKFKVAK